MLPALIAALLAAAPDAPVTVLFAGDVTLGYHHEEWVDELVQKKGVPRDEALGWGFDRVAQVTRAADLFVVNLECPFTTRGEKLPKNFNFRARPELVAALARGGVDVVSLANNHLMDFGPEGLTDTLETLAKARIAAFGAGDTLTAARRPIIVRVQGLRLAFLGAFFLGDRNLEPAAVLAGEATPGVAGHYSSLEDELAMITTDVRAARLEADHVFVFFHWGREGRGQPEPYQVALAHAAIDAGASAVIGSHPHVLQGLESYRGAPIAYSLGNFVFGGNWDPRDKRTALLRLTLRGRAVTEVALLPALSDAFPERPVQPYFPAPERAEEIRREVAELSAGFPEVPAPLRGLRGPPDAGVTKTPPR